MSIDLSSVSAAKGHSVSGIEAPSAKNVEFNSAETAGYSSTDAKHFSDLMSKHKATMSGPPASGVSSANNANSVGSALVDSLGELSAKINKGKEKLRLDIDKAVESGDQAAMMKVMVDMKNQDEFVQMSVKLVSKAGESVKQLTQMQ